MKNLINFIKTDTGLVVASLVVFVAMVNSDKNFTFLLNFLG